MTAPILAGPISWFDREIWNPPHIPAEPTTPEMPRRPGEDSADDPGLHDVAAPLPLTRAGREQHRAEGRASRQVGPDGAENRAERVRHARGAGGSPAPLPPDVEPINVGEAFREFESELRIERRVRRIFMWWAAAVTAWNLYFVAGW